MRIPQTWNFTNTCPLLVSEICLDIYATRDMYDALVFVTKYDNAEAENTIFIDFAGIVFFASAFTYFVAKTCASYISCCVDIHRYLVYIKRRNIRQVMLNSAIQHF